MTFRPTYYCPRGSAGCKWSHGPDTAEVGRQRQQEHIKTAHPDYVPFQARRRPKCKVHGKPLRASDGKCQGCEPWRGIAHAFRGRRTR